MYAIVDIAGQQFKVEKDKKIFVHRLEGEEGSKIDFDQVLLLDNDGKVTVGTPLVKGVVVSASILAHVKGDKVKVFKKKRRKGYQTLNGHRQFMTELLIENIGAGTAKASPKKAEEAPKAKAETKPAADKKTASPKAAAKKAEPKTKAAAKPAAKKAAPAKKTEPKATKPAAKPKAKATASKTAKPAAKPKAAAKPKKADDKK